MEINGNAFCASAYQIYAIFLTISSIGVPNAISKMVAENISIGNIAGSKRILKISICIFSFIGLICSISLYLMANFIANKILQISIAENILKVLAPSIVFVSISAVIRGYFNGKNNVKLSAKTQTVEQVVKTVITIIFVEFVSIKTNYATESMAQVSMLAASIATLISFIYIMKEYFKIEKNDRFKFLINDEYKESVIDVIKELIYIVIPISITYFLILLESNIDSITIIRLLKDKVGEEIAKEKYGIIASKINLLTNFALSLNGTIAVALIPEIAKYNAQNDKLNLERSVNFSFLITTLIAVPIMIGMMIYSNEIINFLYPNANKGSELLRLSAMTIIFTSLTQTISGILQGIGRLEVHLKIMVFAMMLKLLINIILIPNPIFLEKGAIVSSIICDIFIFILIFRKVNQILNLKINIWYNLLKLIFITIFSIIMAKLIMNNVFIDFKIKFVIEILITGIIYFILVILFKILDIKILRKSLKLGKN